MSVMLKFVRSPDYENAADDNTDNSYMVTLKAEDTEGNMDTHAVTVTVTDVEDEPMDLMSRYDVNPTNNKIDRGEVLDGIEDYFTPPVGSVVTRDEVLDLIDLFFEGREEN